MNIFISSPYAGDIPKNEVFARTAMHYCIDQGHTPIAPHLLYPQVLDEETDRQKGLNLGLDLLRLMDEVWVFGDTISRGMALEIKVAESLGIPVRYIKGRKATT